jgi:hypothetical protein
VIVDRVHLDLKILGFQNDLGARDGKFAKAAVAEAATDRDALGLVPGLRFEKAASHVSELLREFFDGAVHDRSGFRVIAIPRLFRKLSTSPIANGSETAGKSNTHEMHDIKHILEILREGGYHCEVLQADVLKNRR